MEFDKDWLLLLSIAISQWLFAICQSYYLLGTAIG